MPVLLDGDVRMIESGAMTQWLLEKYGKGRLTVPAGTPEHARYCQVCQGFNPASLFAAATCSVMV